MLYHRDDSTCQWGYRLITLLLPVTIDAGTRANTLVGDTMEITRVIRRDCTESTPPQHDDVRVLSLHPQRSYDLQDRQVSQSCVSSNESTQARTQSPSISSTVGATLSYLPCRLPRNLT